MAIYLGAFLSTVNVIGIAIFVVLIAVAVVLRLRSSGTPSVVPDRVHDLHTVRTFVGGLRWRPHGMGPYDVTWPGARLDVAEWTSQDPAWVSLMSSASPSPTGPAASLLSVPFVLCHSLRARCVAAEAARP